MRPTCLALRTLLAACALTGAATAAPGPYTPQTAPARLATEMFAGQPRGAHATGTWETYLVDPTRPDSPATQARRHIPIQVWYPAEAQPEAERAPWILTPDPWREHEWAQPGLALRTDSVRDAPVAAQARALPVLLYGHGGGFPQFTGTFQAEFLASHGYVVVAVGHPDSGGTAQFADGHRHQPHARPRLSEADKAQMSLLAQYAWGWHQPYDPTAILDFRHALDQLETWNDTPGHALHQRLDLSRVGAYGWSAGGADAIQLSHDDPRVLAAVNQDGWMHGRPVIRTGTPRPVLLFGCGAPELPAAEDHDRWQQSLMPLVLTSAAHCFETITRQGADWYQVGIQGIHHGSFSDLPMLTPEPATDTRRDPFEAHALISALTLAFFEHYLRGAEPGPLLTRQQAVDGLTLLRGSKRFD